MEPKDLKYEELTLEQYEQLKRQVINLRHSCNQCPNGKDWDELRKLESLLAFCTIKSPIERENMNIIDKNNARKR